MRILFTSWAWPSHLYAMVPTAWACRLAGHEVLVASQPALTRTILSTGLPAARVGCDVDAVATFWDIVFAGPAGLAGSAGLEGPAGPAGLAGRAGSRGAGPRVLGLLVALAESMTKDLAELARGWRADLMVFDPTAFAGPLAAELAGIPAVRHLYGTDLMSAAAGFLPPVLAPLAERFGLPSVDPFGLATVDPYPGELQVDVASRRIPLCARPFNGPGVMPARPAGAPPVTGTGRRRVCVTWGTTLGRIDPQLFLAGPVLRGIGDLEVDLVVAITREQRAMLGSIRSDVQVVESAPLHLVLPGCDAVIAHGGAGSLLSALACGIPQLLVPRLPDHVRHAGRLAATGAAVVVPAETAEPAALTDGLTRVLDDPGYLAAAGRLRTEWAAQPPAGQLVAELERIVAAAP